jgi:hypothetical protein
MAFQLPRPAITAPNLFVFIYGGAAAVVFGLVSALSAFGAMRLLRAPEDSDGKPGGGAPRR